MVYQRILWKFSTVSLIARENAIGFSGACTYPDRHELHVPTAISLHEYARAWGLINAWAELHAKMSLGLAENARAPIPMNYTCQWQTVYWNMHVHRDPLMHMTITFGLQGQARALSPIFGTKFHIEFWLAVSWSDVWCYFWPIDDIILSLLRWIWLGLDKLNELVFFKNKFF